MNLHTSRLVWNERKTVNQGYNRQLARRDVKSNKVVTFFAIGSARAESAGDIELIRDICENSTNI